MFVYPAGQTYSSLPFLPAGFIQAKYQMTKAPSLLAVNFIRGVGASCFESGRKNHRRTQTTLSIEHFLTKNTSPLSYLSLVFRNALHSYYHTYNYPQLICELQSCPVSPNIAQVILHRYVSSLQALNALCNFIPFLSHYEYMQFYLFLSNYESKATARFFCKLSRELTTCLS